MLFNSYIFVLAFLPLCLIGFYLLESRKPIAAKLWLIAMSLWFYGYFNLYYLLIMLFSIAFNYLIFSFLRKSDRSRKKAIFIAGIVINLGLLFYFKYFDFFISNCNALFGSTIPLRNILLPLGISFFTFQQIGFLADCYRGDIGECSFVDYALFVSFFPQLIAGPIVSYDEMLPQFKRIGNRDFDLEGLARGLYVFILGMSKKVLLADTFGTAVDYVYASLATGINSTEALLAVLFYTLQLYFDFSGYCDMAIGLGLMLGIKIPLNFNSPYKASNIVDFWKRWHITLSRFFAKNIYIPLGGNRRGRARMYCNLLLVFFLSGLWHGAGWNFILWGCMHGILYVITRACHLHKKDKAATAESAKGLSGKLLKLLAVILTFAFVNIAWVFFRAPHIEEALEIFRIIGQKNFALPGGPFIDAFNLSELWYLLKIVRLTNFSFSRYILPVGFTLLAMLVTFFAPNVHELADRSKYTIWTAIILSILFVWCVLSFSGVSSFLYFNF